jgi:hypothetical protein
MLQKHAEDFHSIGRAFINEDRNIPPSKIRVRGIGCVKNTELLDNG